MCSTRYHFNLKMHLGQTEGCSPTHNASLGMLCCCYAVKRNYANLVNNNVLFWNVGILHFHGDRKWGVSEFEWIQIQPGIQFPGDECKLHRGLEAQKKAAQNWWQEVNDLNTHAELIFGCGFLNGWFSHVVLIIENTLLCFSPTLFYLHTSSLVYSLCN